MDRGAAVIAGHAEAEADRFVYGVIAEFEDADHVIAAAGKARAAGYRRMDAYTPFPVEGLSEALGHRDHYVPFMMLVAGICGGLGGFLFLYWAMAVDYIQNVGGRPLLSWPYLIPITFECTVLASAFTGVIGMLAINGLPQPYHPVFDAPNFDQATSSRFFLCIEATDRQFDRLETRRFMETLGAAQVSEVEEIDVATTIRRAFRRSGVQASRSTGARPVR